MAIGAAVKSSGTGTQYITAAGAAVLQAVIGDEQDSGFSDSDIDNLIIERADAKTNKTLLVPTRFGCC